MERNKILLTGGSGFLGKILKNSLQKDHEVRDIQEFSSERIDISNMIDVNIDYSPDIVIHAAGKAHSVPKTKEESELFYAVNLQGTVNMVSAIESLPQKPKSFIFISTVSVYGLERGECINEGYPLKGESPYAKSKIMAEEFLSKWTKENGIVLGILRLPLIAGPNPPGNLGLMINGIKSGKYLSIGKADAKKSIIWAEDIAEIIPKLAKVGGVYNLTDGYHPSFAELENAISMSIGRSKPFKIPALLVRLIGKIGDLLGSKAPINSQKFVKITSTLTFDDNKAIKELGWKPTNVLVKIKNIV